MVSGAGSMMSSVLRVLKSCVLLAMIGGKAGNIVSPNPFVFLLQYQPDILFCYLNKHT